MPVKVALRATRCDSCGDSLAVMAVKTGTTPMGLTMVNMETKLSRAHSRIGEAVMTLILPALDKTLIPQIMTDTKAVTEESKLMEAARDVQGSW